MAKLTPAKRIGWVAASFGAMAAHLGLQIASVYAVAAALFFLYETAPESALFRLAALVATSTMGIMLVSQVVSLFVAVPWRCALKSRRLGRRGALDGSGQGACSGSAPGAVPMRQGDPFAVRPPSSSDLVDGVPPISSDMLGVPAPNLPPALPAAAVDSTAADLSQQAPLLPEGVPGSVPAPPVPAGAAGARVGDEPNAKPVTWKSVVGSLLVGLAMQYCFSVLLTLVLPLFPAAQADYNETMAPISTFNLVTMLSVAILAPVVEELFYRGVALEFSRRAFPDRFWAANVVQALAFALAHMNLVQGMYTFVGGLLLGDVYRAHGKLWLCVLMHFSLNLSSFFVLLPDSVPGMVAVGVAAAAALVGSVWLARR